MRESVESWGARRGGPAGDPRAAGRDTARELRRLGDRLEKKLDEQLEKMLEGREILKGALDVQDSPVGRKRHKGRNDREYAMEVERLS